jgi:hypothetical protein
VAEISLCNRQGTTIRMALAQYLQYMGAARANIGFGLLMLILAPESLSRGRQTACTVFCVMYVLLCYGASPLLPPVNAWLATIHSVGMAITHKRHSARQ